MKDAFAMSGGRRLSQLPSLILRRSAPFVSVPYLPEWSFWFFVFEICGPMERLPIAESSGRFFVENYPRLNPPPESYVEADKMYGRQWWSSIQPPVRERADAW